MPRETPRVRQVRAAVTTFEDPRDRQVREAVATADNQDACGEEWDHFLTAPLPELGGRRQCIACKAVVE